MKWWTLEQDVKENIKKLDRNNKNKGVSIFLCLHFKKNQDRIKFLKITAMQILSWLNFIKKIDWWLREIQRVVTDIYVHVLMIVVHEYPKVKMFCINYEQRQHVPLQLHIEANRLLKLLTLIYVWNYEVLLQRVLIVWGKFYYHYYFFGKFKHYFACGGW